MGFVARHEIPLAGLTSRELPNGASIKKEHSWLLNFFPMLVPTWSMSVERSAAVFAVAKEDTPRSSAGIEKRAAFLPDADRISR